MKKIAFLTILCSAHALIFCAATDDDTFKFVNATREDFYARIRTLDKAPNNKNTVRLIAPGSGKLINGEFFKFDRYSMLFIPKNIIGNDLRLRLWTTLNQPPKADIDNRGRPINTTENNQSSEVFSVNLSKKAIPKRFPKGMAIKRVQSESTQGVEKSYEPFGLTDEDERIVSYRQKARSFSYDEIRNKQQKHNDLAN